MPKPALLEGWAAQVPQAFRFVLKASQRITHLKRLKEAGDEVAYFFGVAATLGERLGPALFQLPPNLKKDLPRLEAFLGTSRRGGARPSSSATRRGSRRRSSRRSVPAAPRSASPRTRSSRRPSSPRRTGATCACAGRTTSTPTSPRGPSASARSSGARPTSSSSTRTPVPGRSSRRSCRPCSPDRPILGAVGAGLAPARLRDTETRAGGRKGRPYDTPEQFRVVTLSPAPSAARARPAGPASRSAPARSGSFFSFFIRAGRLLIV